jgi:hypothetical protein
MRSLKFLAASFLAIASLSAGNAIAGNSYKVSAKITENGATVATPVLVVKAGSPASVVIAGDKGYRFTIQVDSAEGGSVDVTARAETSAGEIDSTLTGNLDTPMTVATGDIGLEITVAAVGG